MSTRMEAKYPHAARLFLFCRRVLDHKFGGVRIIDQDVGQILGFDPADCSHWKKGKKNIRSIQAMKLIADHLGVDERLIVDVASGEMDDAEAFFEYLGYGAFSLDSEIVETARKEFFRKFSLNWTGDKESEFRSHFNVADSMIDEVVTAVHRKIKFDEAPLYIPEVVAAFPKIRLVGREVGKEHGPESVHANHDGEQVIIHFPVGSEGRPYVRFQIAREMAAYFLGGHTAKRHDALGDHWRHVVEVQKNLFAAKILAPAPLIRREIEKVNVTKDIVQQLAEVFWVSKTFMSRRIRDIIQYQPLL